MSEGHSMEVDPANQLAAVPQSDALIDGFTVPEVVHCRCPKRQCRPVLVTYHCFCVHTSVQLAKLKACWLDPWLCNWSRASLMQVDSVLKPSLGPRDIMLMSCYVCIAMALCCTAVSSLP